MICGLQIQQITTEQSDPRLPLVNSSLSLKLQILISHDKALHAGRATPTFWWQELSQQRPNLHLSNCGKYLHEQAAKWSYETSSFIWMIPLAWVLLEVSAETPSADSTCSAEFQGHWGPSQHEEYPETTTHLHCPQHHKETGFLSSLYKMQMKIS